MSRFDDNYSGEVTSKIEWLITAARQIKSGVPNRGALNQGELSDRRAGALNVFCKELDRRMKGSAALEPPVKALEPPPGLASGT